MLFYNKSAFLSLDILLILNYQLADINYQCRLRIYKISFNQAVVVVSKPPINTGCSSSNEVINLIDLVCYQFSLSRHNTMWIEHSYNGYAEEQESYEELIVIETYVCRKKINKQKLEELLQIRL